MMKRLVLAAVLVCLGGTAGLAQAVSEQSSSSDQPKAAQFPVSAWNGSLKRTIDIAVPAFRGLEPDLSLSYDSARGLRNISPAGGILGVGWEVDGLSAIERISGTPVPAAGTEKQASGRGVPAFGAAGFAADSFALDGAELISCAEIQSPSSSPSCAVPVASGKTAYTGRIESYQRIRQNVTDNSWEVTNRSGIVYLYRSFEGVAASALSLIHI